MACVCSYVSGHITLTFPPARKYAFDFMDNIRTRGPCGVPKGNTHTDQFHYPHEEGENTRDIHWTMKFICRYIVKINLP
jgi:hypothetical protein